MNTDWDEWKFRTILWVSDYWHYMRFHLKVYLFFRSYTSSVSTGYCVSESVYFAMADWLTDLESVFQVGGLLPLLPLRIRIRPDPLLIGLPDPDHCDSNLNWKIFFIMKVHGLKSWFCSLCKAGGFLKKWIRIRNATKATIIHIVPVLHEWFLSNS